MLVVHAKVITENLALLGSYVTGSCVGAWGASCVRGSCVKGSCVKGSCVRGSCVRGSCVRGELCEG